ncbi:MAG: CorA family divalent cation transporter [Bacteroidales bacterium]|jgi:magnesium transporter|nr:magnesium and cobalt transport protein CorA [Bacteroidales bacterium]MDD2280101.1 CorA family divalent cation transporter [Bacteroidales bacterium]MDD4292719.1 CorA family divalent cation transporter [Bacteroidales bacterium]MDD4491450.1 CorA family divalent cation transporter [Bacteroidales bacterium]HNW48311.1 CorA family divalent cation transporter [Bacteroidales bacterium]
MLEIYYKQKGQVVTTCEIDALDQLGYDDVLWIDLSAPTGEEKRAIETFLNTTLQSRAQAEEIESSSRYSENETAIFANTNFLIPGPESYSMEAVSFILCEGIIVTIRHVPLKSFTDVQRRILSNFRALPTGYHILVGILENRIDLDADMIELMSKEIAQYSKKVSLGGAMGEELLLDINQLQENTMLVRENVVDKQRMISSILKSDKFPRDVFVKLNVLIKDINSLINHTNFSFERLEYLQNTILGLINLEQNRIMKIFTFVSLLFMPPTLIASIFGMNVNLPIFGNLADFAMVMLIMLIAVGIVLIFFKMKKML